MYVIEWTLVVRAIESPAVGALVGLPLAATLATWGFRRQKAIERRADWYERVHRDLVQLKSAHALANIPEGSLQVSDEHRLIRSVQEAQLAFISTSAEAALYAERRALTAVMTLRRELEALAEDESRGSITEARVMRTVGMIQQASDEVADEFRSDMKMSHRATAARGSGQSTSASAER